jgi:hypothetical protein
MVRDRGNRSSLGTTTELRLPFGGAGCRLADQRPLSLVRYEAGTIGRLSNAPPSAVTAALVQDPERPTSIFGKKKHTPPMA